MIFRRIMTAAAGILVGCMLFGGTGAKAGVLPTGSAGKTIEKFEDLKEAVAESRGETESEQASTSKKKRVSWNDNFTKEDLRYMSCIIFCEANDMGHDAMVAVANVIINRRDNKNEWGHVNTIKEVIYDRKWGVQFSPTGGTNPVINSALEVYDHLEDYKNSWKYEAFMNSIEAAKAAFCGEKAVPDNYLYFNGHIDATRSKCRAQGKSFRIIDKHIYY